MQRAGLLILLLSLMLTGCGGSTGESAGAPTEATTNFAPPEPPSIDFAEFETPADNAEGDEWAREHLDLYVRTYQHCDSRVADPTASTYDPTGVVSEREDLARDAADEGQHAPWVAWNACSDGISQTPRPIRELDYLRPEP